MNWLFGDDESIVVGDVTEPISELMFTPRDYQAEAVAAIESELGIVHGGNNVDSTLAVLATGLGKTEIICEITRRHANRFGRVMVIAHTKELVRQAAAKIEKRTGIKPDIEQGDNRADERPWGRSQIVVASKDSLHASRRARFSGFGLLVVDGAHHFSPGNESYLGVWKHFKQDNPDCKMLGVTATPVRGDGISIGSIFETCAYKMGISDAVDLGWLVPARVNCITVQSLSLADVKTGKGGDLNINQLAEQLEIEKPLREIATIAVQEGAGELKTVVFCHSVNQAEAISGILEHDFQIKSAWVCGDKKRCSNEQRKEALDGFAAGDIRVLCNVAVLTEGWDCAGMVDEETGEVLDEGVQHIVMARPTKQLGTYEQMFGRGTRPIPGTVDFDDSTAELRQKAIKKSKKPFIRITDLVDNSMKHRLVSAVDVMAGIHVPVDVLKLANEKLRTKKSDKPVDPKKILERAQKSAETAKKNKEKKQRLREEKLALRTTAIYERFKVNPFDTTGQHIESITDIEVATNNQIGFLKSKGFNGASKLTKKEATAIIIRFNHGERMADIQRDMRQAEIKRRQSQGPVSAGEATVDDVNAMLSGEAPISSSGNSRAGNESQLSIDQINDLLRG